LSQPSPGGSAARITWETLGPKRLEGAFPLPSTRFDFKTRDQKRQLMVAMIV